MNLSLLNDMSMSDRYGRTHGQLLFHRGHNEVYGFAAKFLLQSGGNLGLGVGVSSDRELCCSTKKGCIILVRLPFPPLSLL